MFKVAKLSDLHFTSKFFGLLFILPSALFLTNSRILLIIVIFVCILFIIFIDVNLKAFWEKARYYILLVFVGIFSLSVIFYNLPLQQRIIEGLIISAKFVLFTTFGLLFVLNTSPLEISTGLLQLGIPHSIGMTVMASFRIFPLLIQKIRNIIDAQKSRGLRFFVLAPTKLLLVFSSLTVPIFHSTLEISLQMSETILSRGYDPKRKITVPPFKLASMDYGLLLVSLVLLLAALFLRLS